MYRCEWTLIRLALQGCAERQPCSRMHEPTKHTDYKCIQIIVGSARQRTVSRFDEYAPATDMSWYKFHGSFPAQGTNARILISHYKVTNLASVSVSTTVLPTIDLTTASSVTVFRGENPAT